MTAFLHQLNPIACRELLMMSRSPWTFNSRWIAALVLFFLGGGLTTLLGSMGLLAGVAILSKISFYLMLYCVATGVQSTTDAIASEKREGTLGLLLLTLLTPGEIVLGKLVAYGIAGLSTMIATFPIFALFLLQGGVKGSDLAQLFLAAMNALFVAGAIGLCLSVRSRNKRAVGATGGWIIMLLVMVIPGAAQLALASPRFAFTEPVLNSISLANTFSLRAVTTPSGSTNPWLSLLSTHALGWILLMFAAWSLPRCWQDSPRALAETSAISRWQRWKFGNFSSRLKRRKTLLDQNAFVWLACRNRLAHLSGWTLTALVTAGFLGIGLPNGLPLNILLVFTALALNFGLKGLMCTFATQRMAEEIESGGLELILATSLSPNSILEGQRKALWRIFRGPLLFTAALPFLAYLTTSSEQDVPGWMFLGGVFFLCFLFADVHTVALLGLWTPLRKNPRAASGAVFWRALCLPGLIFIFPLLVGMVNISDAAIPLYYLICFANFCFWKGYIQANFERELRLYSERRFAAPGKTRWFDRLNDALTPQPLSPRT